MTGNRVAHPVLISLANLLMDFKSKASNRAFMLLALLPVPKFIEKSHEIRGVLESRLIHECLDFVLKPLKTAAAVGVIMSDPWHGQQYCYTPIAAYIMDYMEAVVIAGVAGKTSPVTTASYKQFGDAFLHPPRTAALTLSQLAALRAKCDPDTDLALYIKTAKNTYRLNGVDKPFWRDWAMANPANFLTPEPLHYWHRFCWDHEVQWCLNALGVAELDFRFSVLPPHVGYWQFKEGISKLKQVTGRDHRNIQRYLIGAITGGVCREFVIAIRAQMDFRYLGQAPEFDESSIMRMDQSLKLFHKYKDVIVDLEARRGKGGGIENWYIPKLELLQSVVPNIRANGAPMQWTANHTEHAHITEVKTPACAGNNQHQESQIARHLDRMDKCRRFDLATSVRDAGVSFGTTFDAILDTGDQQDTTEDLLQEIDPVFNLSPMARKPQDYFAIASYIADGKFPNAPQPYCTFTSYCHSTAYHLSRDPTMTRASIGAVAAAYDLTDLSAALKEYVTRFRNGRGIYDLGGRRSSNNLGIPFTALHVWDHIHMQSKTFHKPHRVLSAQTLHAVPKTKGDWQYGRFDFVLINRETDKVWPYSGIHGMTPLAVARRQLLT